MSFLQAELAAVEGKLQLLDTQLDTARAKKANLEVREGCMGLIRHQPGFVMQGAQEWRIIGESLLIFISDS